MSIEQRKYRTCNMEWNGCYHGVRIRFRPQIIQVENENELRIFFMDKMVAAYRLAIYCKREYEKRYGKPLGIDTRSLSVELYGHFRLQEMTLWWEKRIGKNRASRWMMEHMCIIDCGEKEMDNNRFVWDLMARVFYTKGR